MKIIITRHGQTNHNIANVIQGHEEGDINDVGYNQIENLAKKLKKYNINKIISSDVKRCRVTSEIISSFLSLNIEYEPLIREKNNGDLIGKKGSEVNWDIIHGSFISKRPHNGENLLMVRSRAREFIKKIENDFYNENNRILIVSHSGYLKILLGYILGMKIRDSILRLQIDNCSISEIEIHKNKSVFEYKIISLHDDVLVIKYSGL